MPSIVHSGLRDCLASIGPAFALAAIALGIAAPVSAQTALADQPVLSNPAIPGNLVLPLSVEFPTGVSVAHSGAYDPARARGYLGIFDRTKCYSYQYYAVETATQVSHFYPNGVAAANYNCAGQTGRWSGNFLNWATTQTIDPFRVALTGGKRLVDTQTLTVLEKARATGQGGNGNFPTRSTTGATVVGNATPFGWTDFRGRIQGLNNQLRFSNTTDTGSNLDGAVFNYDPGIAAVAGIQYNVSIRVRVCNPAAPGGLDTHLNCVLYGSNYKPEGLIQQYSDRIRYSVFGYLNDGNIQRDGAVLRARQKFVAPLAPRPGQSSIVNPLREWDATTGVMLISPDTADATAFGSTVANSGVINYLNKFGDSGSYKGFDPVGELYYAAIRYLKNQGNVSAWSDQRGGDAAALSDGFPVITNWGDPIQYSCQSNFILGIGDVNTHADKNVPGATATGNEPGKPTAVSNDTTVDAVAETNRVGVLEGMGNDVGTLNPFNGCCNNNSALMAGLAYHSHVRDMRSDLTGRQTVKTFWVDVLEPEGNNPNYQLNNQYYLAAKYGGFNLPDNFNPDSTGANGPAAVLGNLANWNTNGQTLTVGSALSTGTVITEQGGWPAATSPNRRPDTYFTAGDPQAMIAGLTEAFSRIATDLRAATTSFALSTPQVADSGNASFSAAYSSGTWTGTVVGSQLDFDIAGVATRTQRWTTDDVFDNQLAGAGWDTGRRIVSYTPGVGGVPFRTTVGAGISAAQLLLLDTPYGAGVDGGQYLNYLRGDRSNEVGRTGALGYRARGADLLGDIAGSKLTVVAAPNARYSDAVNPGYAAFRAAEANRPTLVFAGANDGMVHAFNGALTGTAAGQEVFAYVPSALLADISTPTTQNANGLVSRGNPVFDHRALVDATPEVFDIDFGRVGGTVGTPNWRSVLIGGLGKGGRSYYAINVTNPGAAASETDWAARVLWEFPNAGTPAAAVAQMGFSFGRPLVTKTAKYGWVVVFASGYSEAATTSSALFFVNPANGALLETVTIGTAADPSEGLANVQAYQRDFADNTAESLYAGDLRGNIWRVDVRAASGAYPAPVLLAQLTTPDGSARQPVTTRVLVEVDPASGRRYVLVGTGRLLDSTEINSTSPQTFYAIIDGTRGAFSSVLPTGFSFPITRNTLVANTDTLLTGAGVTATTARPFGWYLDLGVGTGGRAWRVVLDPATNAGRVSFATLLPDGGACSSDNTSRFYQVSFGGGQSVLLNNADSAIAYSEQPGVVIDVRYLCRGSQCKAYTGLRNTDGTNSISSGNERGITLPGLRRLNWRELQIVQ